MHANKFNIFGKTLARRLSLWYLASIVSIFLLFAFTITGLFWATLKDQIDHHVHIAVTEAHQIVQNYKGDERDSLIKNLVSGQGMTVVVLSPVLETNSPDVALTTEHQLQRILAFSNLTVEAPIHFTVNNIRFAAMPVTVSSGNGIVAVGYSTQVLNATYYKMLLIIIGVLCLGVLPATLIGQHLLKKQLLPLNNIAEQAKSVSNLSSLSTRITINSPTEELETIQIALNTMLSQLEKTFNSEREFFAEAAHTLKTPLAVLRSQIENSSLDLMQKNELLETIDHANDTIQDLLFLSKVGAKPQDTTEFSLSTVMTDLAELAVTLGEELSLSVTVDIQKNVSIVGDKKLLQRALSNIVHNAVIYNKPHGSILLVLKEENRNIKIIVKDSGRGISKNEQSRIFSRFYRGEDVKTPGSGLGLAISKAVIEQMNGTITFSSIRDTGTKITILFSH